MRNTTKVEALIESCRSEGKWKKVIELTEDLKSGSSNNECLINFLIGEAKLEHYIDENPPSTSNNTKAKNVLQDAKKFLQMVTGENGHKDGIALDAHLLLAKLHYACGEQEKSLEHFQKAELNTLSEKELTLRSLRILAESYAIKGLCLEYQMNKPSSKFKRSEKEAEMVACFERAADLGLLYLQEQDIAFSLPINNTIVIHPLDMHRKMGAILETALQRAPIILIKAGKLQDAIERYRLMLTAIETKTTQPLRLTLARQLAEVLLRGVSGTIYCSPHNPSQFASTAKLSTKRLWKPKNYANRNQFVPRNQQEETLLLILITEALAVKDTVLSQSPEFRIARQHAMGNATAVYDLLSLATVRWGLINLLNESFEKSLKFSCGEQHIWRQYGVSLVATGKHSHGLKVLEESMRLTPSDPVPCLLAARLCYENLSLIEDGLKYSIKATLTENKGVRPSRSYLYVGIGYQQLAIQCSLKSGRECFSKLALDALEKAVQLDGQDHLCEYYLSLQHALGNDIPEALTHIKSALSLRTEHAPSLHLFALLLTASKRTREALLVVENSLEEFPENLNLLHVKAHLQLHLQGAEYSLATVQKMLYIWRDLYDGQPLGEDEKQSDTKSTVLPVHHTAMSDKDSNSIYAASLAAVSRVEQALSEAASSLSSFSQKPGPQRAWMMQIKIWLLLADIYLSIEQPNEALNCIQEASQINPLSHQIMYMRGLVSVYLEQWNDAKQSFLNSMAINPNQSESLRALGETHYMLGEQSLAEKVLKDAIKLDPNCSKTWISLGKVMESLNDFTAAADCMAAALQLEPTCPILPFTSITLAFD